MNAVKEKAYSKINLFLDVTGKREDGFHDVVTVMHSLSLSDDITVCANAGAGRIRVLLDGNNRLPTDSKNLAYLAAKVFMDTAGIKSDITIKLNKKIPVSAGLAGGSSDAAAVLRAMNKLFKRPLTDKLLLEVAARLGSDVPFCLIGGTALCFGRGEKIERLPSNLKLHCVVAIGDEHVSTPVAYAALDKLYSDFDGTVTTKVGTCREDILASVKEGQIKSGIFNIFEDAVLPICPIAAEIKDKMYELGASHALMSGSGPSVYGIFENEDVARAAALSLSECGVNAYYSFSAY
jgi:4-diphosphocytidyl-2-C-methyl-D-erythritol kinase